MQSWIVLRVHLTKTAQTGSNPTVPHRVAEFVESMRGEELIVCKRRYPVYQLPGGRLAIHTIHSKKHVVPDLSISAIVNLVATWASSLVMDLCSGRIRSASHVSLFRLSAVPRSSVWTVWTCVDTSPGITTHPARSYCFSLGYFANRASHLPMSAMVSLSTWMAPSSMIRLVASRVIMVAWT